MSFKVAIDQSGLHPIVVLEEIETGTRAEIYAFGGLLNAFTILKDDQPFNCIHGFESVTDASQNITNGFKSAKISPFVCRLQHGQYQFNGQPYTIQKHYLGPHALHGLLFDAVFTIKDTFSNDEMAAVDLQFQYQQSDPGYPFAFSMMIRWELRRRNHLTVTTTVTHHNDQPIPYADGWHPYFTLGGSINDYTLQFDSDRQLEFDATLIPTGKKIADTRFTEAHQLNTTHLDNAFELKFNGQCVLSHGNLQLTIQPDESYPILQVYTPDHRQSIAIENLSGAPDNFNNGIGLLLLMPNRAYRFSTIYQLQVL